MSHISRFARTAPPADLKGGGFIEATQPQLDFIQSLLEERDVPTDSEKSALIDAYENHNLGIPEGSELIRWLQSQPKIHGGLAGGRTADMPDVPAGRYAVDGEDGTLKFYRVRKVEKGKWAGWTFVDVQASSDFYPIRGLKAVRPILTKIAEDPREAAVRYGQELGRCCICGRTLTNDVSRHYGIGPVCAGRTGWFGQLEINELARAGE